MGKASATASDSSTGTSPTPASSASGTTVSGRNNRHALAPDDEQQALIVSQRQPTAVRR